MFLLILFYIFKFKYKNDHTLWSWKAQVTWKNTKILSRDIFEKEKKMEKYIIELGTCRLAFAKQTSCWSFWGVASSIVWNSSSEGGYEISLLKLEELFMTSVLFFMTSFLVALTPTFVLLGLPLVLFVFVFKISIVASISFEMFLITWSNNVSKFREPSLGPCWRM